MSKYYIKYLSKIFGYKYEDAIEADSVNDAIAKFRKTHRDTAEILEIVMAIQCQAIVDELDRQAGFNSPWRDPYADVT